MPFARIFKFKEYLRLLYIKLSNMLINKKKYTKDRILLLLPHCLQISTCDIRITTKIQNCKICGRCPIDDISKIKTSFGINVFIATGGNLARKIITEVKPKMVIACACSRDLSEGIHDIFPIPVYGILLSTPNGPCRDTKVDIDKLKLSVEQFLEQKK